MVSYYFRTLKDPMIKRIDQPRTGVWVHVLNPSREELHALARTFGLDAAILADAQDFFEVPRMERSGNATYFFTRYPYRQSDADEDVDTAPLCVVMGESFTITIALREVPQFESFFTPESGVYTTQKAKFFIQIMDVITSSFETKLTHLRRAVHRNRINLRTIGNREITRLVNYEHELNDIIAALVPTNTWLQRVTQGNIMQLYQEDIALMEDLLIANSQLIDSARAVLKTTQNVRTASEAILTNNLNASLRTLTLLTVLLTVPTIMASLFGMNVTLPLAGHPYAFWLIVLTIVAAVTLLVWFFRRNRWI